MPGNHLLSSVRIAAPKKISCVSIASLLLIIGSILLFSFDLTNLKFYDSTGSGNMVDHELKLVEDISKDLTGFKSNDSKGFKNTIKPEPQLKMHKHKSDLGVLQGITAENISTNYTNLGFYHSTRSKNMPNPEPESGVQNESTTENISMNPESVLAYDIASITHDRIRSTITINLFPASSRRCIDPVFRGRLSGSSLAIIEWLPKDVNDPSTSNTIIGRYQVPTSDTYFVEIIALLCDSIAYDTNFTSTCLENPRKNRITASTANGADAFITGTVAKNDGNVGRWVSKGKRSPLQTRFQPRKCPPSIKRKRCIEATSVERFLPYMFEWDDIRLDERDNTDSFEKVCVLGDSQARQIEIDMHKLDVSNIVTMYISLEYPVDFTDFFQQSIIGNSCTKVVANFGQKPASFQEEHPWLFSEYEQKMQNFLSLKGLFTRHNVDLFVRSVNYIPISFRTGACPPVDWRSPPVIDQYNTIIRKVCAMHMVTFIDSNFIIGPMWDRSDDFNHYKDEAGDASARYILNRVLEII
uniref:Uncharacterized protein n=1 Tax=Corethron hystrix TaxID=216773 RepID=A0A7S1C2A9_9STRA|mmetsp:Transcript_8432/g.18504  ORF Transcript_8432/g.18504 Transcript_8432/m.18504 type:complete len:526 (+) Transcript_8432:194-1771(+)